MQRANGYLLHEGTVNGHEFVVIATVSSKNAKTGDMAQVWFLLRDIPPREAVKSGIDAETICRECVFAKGNGCYVNVSKAPTSVWKSYHRGNYPKLEPRDYFQVFQGRKIRFGAYGNPSLLPVAMVKSIASVSKGWTGYFHDWRTNPYANQYAQFFMASTETQSSHKLAQSLGYRTFHASPVKPDGMIECLADSHNMTCAQCKLCCGLEKSRLPSVWINPHGAKKNKANAAALGN